MSEDFDTTRFFHEGVATFVECQWFLPAAARDEKRLVAAVLRARGLVEFEQLIDNQRLCAKLDGNVVYPLGEAFTAALVKKFGDEAVGKICRAWGQSDAPRDLAGIRKWYDTFQRCGYDLDAAIDAFYGLLDEEVALRRQLIESLEQPRGEADVVEGRVHVVATWKPLEGWNIVCRFRPTEDSLELHFTEGERDETGFSGPHVITFPSSRAWYQLGIQSDRGTVIYQPWTPFDLSQTR